MVAQEILILFVEVRVLLSLRLFLNLKKWKQRKGKKNWNDL